MRKLMLLIAVIFYACSQSREERIDELFKLAARTDSTEKPDSSIYYYSKIIELDSLNHPAFYFRGRAYFNMGQFEKGIPDLNKAISLSPKSGYYVDRGVAFASLQEYEKGEDDFKQAIKLDPHNYKGYYGLSMAYAGVGKYQTALNYCNRADSIKLDINQSLSVRVMIYCGIGNYREALDIIKKLIVGERNSIQIGSYYNTMAYAENMLGNYESAMQHLNLSLSLYPDNPYAFNNMAYAYLKTGKVKEALPLVEHSLELIPDNAYAFNTRGQIFLKMNQNHKACEDFERGVELAVDSILINELNGLLHSHCKN